MIGEQKAEQTKNRMLVAAFVGWQTNNTKKSFAEYLKLLGLGERKSSKMTDEMKNKLIERNTSIAERIRKASKEEQRRKKKC